MKQVVGKQLGKQNECQECSIGEDGDANGCHYVVILRTQVNICTYNHVPPIEFPGSLRRSDRLRRLPGKLY